MPPPSYIDRIAALGASYDVLFWLRESWHPDIASAWATCPRGDWMLWLAGRLAGPPGSDSRRPLVLAACACARTALPIYEERYPGDPRPRRAVETAEAWARGEAGLDEVRVAAREARVAADAATSSAASSVADAAVAYATYAADASAAASADAAAAAAASADIDYAVAGYAAFAAAFAFAGIDTTPRARVLAEMADIVRLHYPEPPSLETP